MEKDISQSNTNNYVAKGWQCPVCGRILAPWVSECPCRGFNDQNVITYCLRKI